MDSTMRICHQQRNFPIAHGFAAVLIVLHCPVSRERAPNMGRTLTHEHKPLPHHALYCQVLSSWGASTPDITKALSHRHSP